MCGHQQCDDLSRETTMTTTRTMLRLVLRLWRGCLLLTRMKKKTLALVQPLTLHDEVEWSDCLLLMTMLLLLL